MTALRAVSAEAEPSAVAQIVWHEQQADELQGQVDGHRWEASRMIAAELDCGKTQRQLAEEIGKSQSHVKIMARVAHEYPGTQDRSFNDYYQQVKAPKPQPQPTPQPQPVPDGGSPKPLPTPRPEPEPDPWEPPLPDPDPSAVACREIKERLAKASNCIDFAWDNYTRLSGIDATYIQSELSLIESSISRLRERVKK